VGGRQFEVGSYAFIIPTYAYLTGTYNFGKVYVRNVCYQVKYVFVNLPVETQQFKMLLLCHSICPYILFIDNVRFVLPLTWWRGIVVIASAYRTDDPRFESQQGVRFLSI
jgi:hypothetical protein